MSNSKALVAVSMGAVYNAQTDKMIESFQKHNPDWDVIKFYDNNLKNLLPMQCKSWSPFNMCEIGRWFAMQKALEQYKTIVYSDGDMRWYSKYETGDHGMVLYPHYVTAKAKQAAKHFLYKDGIANIGIMEMSQHTDNVGIFDFVIGEVLYKPSNFFHGEQLWLQNIVSAIPDCGYDCVYNNHAGYNVAFWNLRREDREVIRWEGAIKVGTNENKLYDLVSFHFSSKSLHRLDEFGEVVAELKDGYLQG